MDEVDIQTVDLRHEVRQRFQMRLAPAPIVIRPPVLDEFLQRGELHALVWPHRRRGRPVRREAASDTSSCSGHLVILMRRRSSVTSVSGNLTWKARIAVLSGMGLLLWRLG